jgi:hypothetical protein
MAADFACEWPCAQRKMAEKNPRSLPKNPRRGGASADAVSVPDGFRPCGGGSGVLTTTA